MSEFETVDDVKDAKAALNATVDQFHSAVDNNLTEDGGCVVCGRERHAGWNELQSCVAELTRREGRA